MPIYSEIWAGPGRNYKKLSNGEPLLAAKWYATIHNTSNDANASGEAIYAKIRPDGVGAHYFADSTQVLQSTDTDRCVGHVGSTQGNTRGISYEITGFNGWTRAQWLANVAWDKLAAVIARDCKHFGIPVRLLTIAEMRAYSAGVKGFVTHDMCRQAWGGTDHTDPGPNFPMDHLLALVAAATNGDDMPLTFNERAVLDGIFNLYDEVTLDTDAVDDGKGTLKKFPVPITKAMKSLQADLNELKARPPTQPAPVDAAVVAAAVKAALADPAVLAGIAKAVADEDHKRSAS